MISQQPLPVVMLPMDVSYRPARRTTTPPAYGGFPKEKRVRFDVTSPCVTEQQPHSLMDDAFSRKRVRFLEPVYRATKRAKPESISLDDIDDPEIETPGTYLVDELVLTRYTHPPRFLLELDHFPAEALQLSTRLPPPITKTAATVPLRPFVPLPNRCIIEQLPEDEEDKMDVGLDKLHL